MRKKAENSKDEMPNVEIGMEYGDIITSEMYDIAFVNEKEDTTKKPNKKR